MVKFSGFFGLCEQGSLAVCPAHNARRGEDDDFFDGKEAERRKEFVRTGSLAACPAHNARGRLFDHFFLVQERSGRKKVDLREGPLWSLP